MPNAPTHDAITLITAPILPLAYFRFAQHPEALVAGLFMATYLFAGYACAGDLDLDSTEYRRWGRLRFLWWPYRKLVPHRSWVSHGLILGGMIRAVYLAIAMTLLLWACLWAYSRLGPHVDATQTTITGWQFILAWTQSHPILAGAGLAGFILAGTAHSIADIVYSGLKRRLRVLR